LEDQVREAHAYAYGGAVIQDLGYYPLGSRDFRNLLHYLRSGDSVRELLLQSQDVNEYVFVRGALSRSASDLAGHPTFTGADDHIERCVRGGNAFGLPGQTVWESRTT
jgi:hypothetical protein